MSSVLRPTGRPGNTRAPERTLLVRRLLFLIPGGIALLGGLDAALLLLGLPVPFTTERLALIHAPLMVFAFIGTLVVLERAVAARRWCGFAAPAALGYANQYQHDPLPAVVGERVRVWVLDAGPNLSAHSTWLAASSTPSSPRANTG